MRKALTENTALARFAVLDAVNGIFADTQKMASETVEGKRALSSQEWNTLVEQATPEQLAEVAYRLGIDPKKATASQVRAAVAAMQAAQALDSDGKGAEAYSYEALLKKDKVHVAALEDVSSEESEKYKNSSVLFGKAMRDVAAAHENSKNTETATYLFCRDLNTDVQITRESFKHGAERIDNAYISVCKSVKDILDKSIVVNELSPRETTNGGYVLLGVAENADSYVIVRSVVNKKTWKLQEYEELSAIKKKSVKKEEAGFKPPHYIQENGYGTSSVFSISDFLENVKGLPLAKEVFSMDVLEKLGVARSKGTLSNSVRYSLPQEETGNAESTTKPLPGSISESFTGAQRFSLGEGRADIAVVRMGDLFYLYDYGNERLISEAMDLTALNELLADHARWEATRTKEKEKAPHSGRATERRGMNEETRAIAQLLRENIPAYDEKLARDRTTLRRIYRQATAHGMSIEDALAFTAVAARTGLNIVFDKNRCVSNFGDGGFRYARGFYLSERGTIVINPDAKAELVLIHELDHALRTKYKNGRMSVRVYEEAVNALPDDARKSIVETYEKVPSKLTKEGQYADEANAHYAELALGNMEVVRYLVADNPSLKQRILAFFKKASADYAGIPKLDRAAKKYLKQFKKEFDALSTKESGSLAVNEAVDDALATVGSADARHAIVALEDGKLYVEATRNVINGETTAARRKEITAFFKQLLKNEPSVDIPTIDGDVLTITKAETAEKARDNYKYVDGKPVRMSDEEFLVKLRAESHIDELSEISRKVNSKIDSKTHSFSSDGFSYRSAYFKDFDGEYYEITLSIGHNGTVATVYNVGKMKKSVSPSAKIIAVVESKLLGETLSDNSITETAEKSNPFGEKSLEKVSDKQFALPLEDSTGAGLREDVEKAYLSAVKRKDTATMQKMVDEAAKAAGYAIKAYHGTSNEFTTFRQGNKRTRGSLNFGNGFYFSPSRSFAENYTTTGRVIEGYLKMEKPYEVYGTRFYLSDLETIAKKAGKDVTIDNVREILQQMGYDGIIAKDYDGTTNPVNQYVIYEISDGQVKKLIANYTRAKTYSKTEADEAIHEILVNTLYSEDEQATLRGKSREEVVDMLWQGLNAAAPGKRGAVALEGVKKDEIVKQEDIENDVAQQYSPSSYISIAELIQKINP